MLQNFGGRPIKILEENLESTKIWNLQKSGILACKHVQANFILAAINSLQSSTLV